MKLAGSFALSFYADSRIPDAVATEFMESITDQVDWQIKIITCAIQNELDRCSQEWLAQYSNTTPLETTVINQTISIIDSLSAAEGEPDVMTADETDRLRALLKQASDALGVFYGSGWHYNDDEIEQIEKARDAAAHYLAHNAELTTKKQYAR